MKLLRRYLRFGVCLLFALLAWWWLEGSLLWIGLLLLALFLFGVDVLNFGKAKSQQDSFDERTNFPTGVLGEYEVETDRVYGLFIDLGGSRVLVDLRRDALLEERKERALDLAEHVVELGASLSRYQDRHPEFRHRTIQCIGLHSKNLDQGEVFWSPEGYTLLRGYEFIDL